MRFELFFFMKVIVALILILCFRKLKGTDYLIHVFGSNLFMESVFHLTLKSADWKLCISSLLLSII